jgi:antitoxin component HigA of HigAB toxin-antitoxin module
MSGQGHAAETPRIGRDGCGCGLGPRIHSTGCAAYRPEQALKRAATRLVNDALAADGVTRSELADRLGCSSGFVTQVLSGERNMTLQTLDRFMHALNRRVVLSAEPSR